jgi:hypothetical protein
LEKLLRSLIFYALLFTCVVIAIGVSYTVILHLARQSVNEQAIDPDAIAEARSLQDYARELRDITAMLEEISKEEKSSPSTAFSRRLNDLRRRMRQFPHDSNALNALMQTGDRLLAWAANPENPAANTRAHDALTHAEAAVDSRIETMNLPNSP